MSTEIHTTIDVLASLVRAKNPELGLITHTKGKERVLQAIKGTKPEGIVLSVALPNGPDFLIRAQAQFISRL